MVHMYTVPSEMDVPTMMRMLDLLSSSPMKPCTAEFLAKKPVSELMHKTDILREALLDAKTSESNRMNIYSFLIQVAKMRGEAAEILMEDLIPLTCMDMMEAEKKQYRLLQESATEFLICLSSKFPQLVLSELQFLLKPRSPPPCSVLQALILVASKNPNVSIPHLKSIFSKIASLAEFARDASSQKTITQVVLQFIQIANNYLVEKSSEYGQFTELIFQFYNVFTGFMKTADDEMKGVLIQALIDIRFFLLDDLPGKHAEERLDQQPDNNREDQTVDAHEMQGDISHRVMTLVTQGPESIQEILNAFLPLLESTNASITLVLMAFYTEILSYQDLIDGTLIKRIIEKMVSKINPQDEAMHCLAVRAIGNAAGKAMKKDKAYSHYLLQILMNSRNVMTEGLKSLSQIVIFVHKKCLGEMFEILVTTCVTLMNHRDAAIQMHSTMIFGQLARRSREYFSNRFREAVTSCLHLVLWKVHSKNAESASAAMFTLHHMLPLLGCVACHDIESIYRELAEKNQSVLKDLLFESVPLLKTVAEVCAVVEHITFITDNLKYKKLSSMNLASLWLSLAEVTKSKVPPVQQAAKAAVTILSRKWKSLGTMMPPLAGFRINRRR